MKVAERLSILVLCAMVLSGCASSYLQAPVEMKNHPGHIKQAQIVWEDAKDLPVRMTKTAVGYGYAPVSKPEILEKEREAVNQRVQDVIAAYRSSAPQQLEKALADEGVSRGTETRIVIRPVMADVNIDTSVMHVGVEVLVRHADSRADWRIVPISHNSTDGPGWTPLPNNIASSTKYDSEKLVASFTSAAVRAMRSAGWLR